MEVYFEDLSKNLSLKDKAYNSLKSQIIRGNLKPGERLREEELSNAMNISRAPIREAINQLEKEGFTTIIPRRGAVVTPLTQEDVKNILEMRRLLEPYVARVSVHKISEQEINIMYDKLNSILTNPDDFNAYQNSDLELHELLYNHVDNKILKDTLLMVKQHSLRIRYCAEEVTEIKRDIILQSTKEHLDILDAIKSRDGEKVSNMVIIHLLNTEKRTIPAIK